MIKTNEFQTLAPLAVFKSILEKSITDGKDNRSIFISGFTKTGKTELQKNLIGSIPLEDKILLIQDFPEMHLEQLYSSKHLLSLSVSDDNGRSLSGMTIDKLINTSLDAEFKWLTTSEIRTGTEAVSNLEAMKKGYRVMATIYAHNNQQVLERLSRLAETVSPKYTEDEITHVFSENNPLGVHLSKVDLGEYNQYFIDEVVEFVPFSEQNSYGTKTLFKQDFRNMI